jgi:hypothetical protein
MEKKNPYSDLVLYYNDLLPSILSDSSFREINSFQGSSRV